MKPKLAYTVVQTMLNVLLKSPLYAFGILDCAFVAVLASITSAARTKVDARRGRQTILDVNSLFSTVMMFVCSQSA